MREFGLLVKINFLQLLRSISSRSNGKRNMGAAGALLLMGGLALYISGIYSWVMGSMLSEAGVIEFLIPVMSLFAVVISLLFTAMAASSAVFGDRDMDFMLSLPVGAFWVMLSKMTALYLENLAFVGLWMIPVGIAGYVYGVATDVGYFFRLPLAILALPFLSSLVACLAGFLMAYAGSRMKHKALAANLVSIVLFILLFVGSMQLNQLGALLLANQERAARLFDTWLLPFGLLGKGMSGSLSAFWESLLVCILPFLGLAWLLSGSYKRIISGLNSHALNANYRLTEVKTKGQWMALFLKEIRRLFGTPAYLMNSCVSVVLLVGFSVYLLLDGETMAVLEGLLGREVIAPLLLGCMALMLSMVYPSAVSISLEGKTIWILKEAPVSATALFAAKAGLNLLLTWPASFLAVVVFFTAGYLTPGNAICMLLVCLTLTGLLALAGVAVNLHFPKLDCDSDIRVVKNSASAMLCAFGGMLFTMLLAGVWALTRTFLPFGAFCLVLSALFAALAAGLWRYLTGRGAALFAAL